MCFPAARFIPVFRPNFHDGASIDWSGESKLSKAVNLGLPFSVILGCHSLNTSGKPGNVFDIEEIICDYVFPSSLKSCLNQEDHRREVTGETN